MRGSRVGFVCLGHQDYLPQIRHQVRPRGSVSTILSFQFVPFLPFASLIDPLLQISADVADSPITNFPNWKRSPNISAPTLLTRWFPYAGELEPCLCEDLLLRKCPPLKKPSSPVFQPVSCSCLTSFGVSDLLHGRIVKSPLLVSSTLSPAVSPK